MRKSWFIFSMVLLPIVLRSQGDTSHYEQFAQRYSSRWYARIPTQAVVQNAGNMGLLSAGIGRDYGSRGQWETHLLAGFVPKHESSRAKMTVTLKENYIPWSVPLSTGLLPVEASLEPLTVSLYLNAIFGHEFWDKQPGRYPDGYYSGFSTMLRVNLAVGQRVTLPISGEHRKWCRSVSLFYEVSTCEMYLRSLLKDKEVGLGDILGLSVGIKMQVL